MDGSRSRLTDGPLLRNGGCGVGLAKVVYSRCQLDPSLKKFPEGELFFGLHLEEAL